MNDYDRDPDQRRERWIHRAVRAVQATIVIVAIVIVVQLARACAQGGTP